MNQNKIIILLTTVFILLVGYSLTQPKEKVDKKTTTFLFDSTIDKKEEAISEIENIKTKMLRTIKKRPQSYLSQVFKFKFIWVKAIL